MTDQEDPWKVPFWAKGTTRADWDVFVAMGSKPTDITVMIQTREDALAPDNREDFTNAEEALVAVLAYRLRGLKVHTPDIAWLRKVAREYTTTTPED